MGGVFGDDWALVAEPGADLGSLVAARLRKEEGQITEKDMQGIYISTLFRALTSLRPKEIALSDDFIKNAMHAVGSTLFIGALFKDGRQVISFNADGVLTVNFEELLTAVKELDEQLLSFGFNGSVEDFIAFYRENVQARPDDFIARVRALLAGMDRMYLLNRPE
jgi:hypothetical protein